MAATEALTKDILMDILSRFPVKTLLCFRTVSKYWNSLIQNPDFVNLHQNFKRKKALFVLRTIRLSLSPIGNGWFKTVLTPLEAETLTPITEMNFFELPTVASIKGDVFRRLYMFGPCNDIFCIKDQNLLVLCNPATREFKTVPFPPFSYPENKNSCNVLIGFGFDAIVNDYKIVRVVRPGRRDDYTSYHYSPWKVEIYSLSADTWTETSAQFPFSSAFRDLCEITFNDSCHWLGYDWDAEINQSMFIVVFDVVEEVFQKILLPEEENFFEGLEGIGQLILIVFDGSLAVMKYDLHTTVCNFHLWVMRKYGVIESCNKIHIGLRDEVYRPLASRNVDELFLESGEGELVSCDPKTAALTQIGVLGEQYTFAVGIFQESLTSIKGCCANH